MENIKLTYLSCQIISVLFLSLFSLISSLISLSFQFFKLHFSDLANHMMSSNGSGNVSIPSHKFCLFVCFIFITILSILLSLSFNCDRRSCVDCFNLQQELLDSLPKDLKFLILSIFSIILLISFLFHSFFSQSSHFFFHFKALQSNDGNYRRFNIQPISKVDSVFPRAHTCFNKFVVFYSSVFYVWNTKEKSFVKFLFVLFVELIFLFMIHLRNWKLILV